MTNHSTINEDSFTLVTSQRKNKKKYTNKRLGATQISKPSDEEVVDEELIIR